MQTALQQWFRLLRQMTLLGLFCLLSISLLAHANSSNRLTANPFRSSPIVLGVGITLDKHLGRYDDPLSLHKYLYCHGNPVDGVDPSGYEFVLASLSMNTTIGASLESMYNGVVSGTGSAMQASIFGIQAGLGANEILTGFILDETGISLAISAFNAVRGLFQDRESQEMAAYMLWEEQLIAAILAVMEDDEFGEITVKLEPQCFVAGTPIATEHGLFPIEEVKPGDRVWAWDEATNEVTLRPVINRFIHRRSEVFEIKVGRDTFKVTGEHPFFVAGKGWTPAQYLQNGDQLVTSEDCALMVDAVEKQVGEVVVYNFEVSTDHNYYVGEEGILTHNVSAFRRAMGLKNPLLAAHHIVAIRANKALAARILLEEAGIPISDIRNGVALPRNLKAKAKFPKMPAHSTIHTTEYYREITRRLQEVYAEARVEVLLKAANEIQIGKFPFR